ncbi:soluble lytic transglycosylase [Synechocystis sp. PCC 6803]|nr:soluble lytic transglycosylase [Synechocystis sp. PCC 6803]
MVWHYSNINAQEIKGPIAGLFQGFNRNRECFIGADGGQPGWHPGGNGGKY